MSSPDINIDIAFMSDDLARGDYGALALDAAGALIPVASGLSKAVRGIESAVDVAQAAKGIGAAADAAPNVAKAVDNLTEGIKGGEEIAAGAGQYSDEFLQWLNRGDANNKVYQGIKAEMLSIRV